GVEELERDGRRDKRHEQVRPAVRAAQEGGVQPWRSAALHRRALLQLLGAVLQVDRSRRALDAFDVFAPAAAAGAGTTADTRQFGAGRAAELFEQPAQPGAALRALEQFDRVDPELLEEVRERLGPLRDRDLLFV